MISGPFIKRYFVSVILRFSYEDMPDPEGAKVLKEFGIGVKYKKVKEKEIDEDESSKQNKEVTKSVYIFCKSVSDTVYIWYDLRRTRTDDQRAKNDSNALQA